MEPTQERERRRVSRIVFDAEATVIQGLRSYPVQLLDVSFKGALVRAEDAAAVDGSPATLEVQLANGAQIVLQVTLVHRHDQELGFQCDSLELESAAHLRRLIELNMNRPDAAERVLDEMLGPPSTAPFKRG